MLSWILPLNTCVNTSGCCHFSWLIFTNCLLSIIIGKIDLTEFPSTLLASSQEEITRNSLRVLQKNFWLWNLAAYVCCLPSLIAAQTGCMNRVSPPALEMWNGTRVEIKKSRISLDCHFEFLNIMICCDATMSWEERFSWWVLQVVYAGVLPNE